MVLGRLRVILQREDIYIYDIYIYIHMSHCQRKGTTGPCRIRYRGPFYCLVYCPIHSLIRNPCPPITWKMWTIAHIQAMLTRYVNCPELTAHTRGPRRQYILYEAGSTYGISLFHLAWLKLRLRSLNPKPKILNLKTKILNSDP